MTASAPLLQRAIEGFRKAHPDLDQDASAVCDRLLDDPRAAEAFAAIATVHNAPLLVGACIQCERVHRDFHSILKAEVAMPARLDKLDGGIEAADRFVVEIVAGPRSLLDPQIVVGQDEADRLRGALREIRSIIELRRQLANEAPRRLGATRKWIGQNAGETAALGSLAEAIDEIAERPHYMHAATLGEIVLKTPGPIDPDRVREARRTLQERS